MTFIRLREWIYVRHHLNTVKHATLDPKGPGMVRLYLIPPKHAFRSDIPSVVLINGQALLPVTLSWAILLGAFIDCLTPYDGIELPENGLEDILSKTIIHAKGVYPGISSETLRNDLGRMVDAFFAISKGESPKEDTGCLSLQEYAGHMAAPHRMDLLISAMQKDGEWHCNQKCIHCYAAGQPLAVTQELTTTQWKHILRTLQKAGIPQVTFTGGEPTMRQDLAELIKEAKWFVTRLNTNGVRLTKELCDNLFHAELDSVQVTLYSADPLVHNKLVGSHHFHDTVSGIQNAISAGLNLSINTPLCTWNADYVNTLAFIQALGIRYVTCSGLIVTGNAEKEDSRQTQIESGNLACILREAKAYCDANNMEITFTSPGWVDENTLLEIGLSSVPSCGACLSNMAVAPNGDIIPCQSWLSSKPLGNMLTDKFTKIWDSKACKKIRSASARMEHTCPLRKPDAEV